MKVFYSLIAFIIGCALLYVKGHDADRTAEKLNLSEITVKIDSEWHRIAGRNVLSTESKIALLRGNEPLTKFGFNESFNWNEEKVTQTGGIHEFLSAGITLFRHWE